MCIQRCPRYRHDHRGHGSLVKFPYLALPTSRPISSLAGANVRFRPIIPVRILGPAGSWTGDCSVDCGTDDTIFPRRLATKLGIDLTGAEQVHARPIGSIAVPYLYAKTSIRLTDGVDVCEWEAIVGFVDVPLRWPILGHAGFLQYFDVNLFGAKREVELMPNVDLSGRRTRLP